jgi:epoxyqueuosine reductase QueG
MSLENWITETIHRMVSEAGAAASYRPPLVGFVSADDPRFDALRRDVEPTHMRPQDLLPGARVVLSYFLPFARWVVKANAREREAVAREWAVAYVETNALIGRITARLIEELAERGVRAAGEPATSNFDPTTLVCRWSHKSVAVIAGLGSFGLHHMVITDAGCAGRFGSLVLDADLSVVETPPETKERCLYFQDGSCQACVARCPAGALSETGLDKQRCWARCREVAREYVAVGLAEVCGKCVVGPCAFEAAARL